MPADTTHLPEERPIVRCPSGLRGDQVRALEMRVRGVAEELANCRRIALEIDCPLVGGMLGDLRQPLLGVATLVREDPR